MHATQYVLKTGDEFYKVPETRELLDESQELEAWQRYLRWHREIFPKCRFSPKGIANTHERRRRWTLFAMFRLIRFRSQSPEIRAIFTRCLGQLSLQWMVACCGTQIPAFYYEWLVQSQPKSLTTWGDVVIDRLWGSEEHLEWMARHRNIQIEKLTLKRVMGS